MACLGIQIGSSGCRRVSVSAGTSEDMICPFRPSLVEFRDDRRSRCRRTGVCLAKLGKSEKYSASVANTLPLVLPKVNSARDKKKPVIPPHLDHLMKQSVTEIVKNISEAPFLVHVYSEGENGHTDQHSLNNPLKLEIEKATSESWPFISQRWEGINSTTPDGVILVEELDSEEAMVDIDKEEIASSSIAPACNINSKPSATKVWGLLVQGRGATCPSCYILKTCRVQCCSGFSTHFCLAKVDCFGKSIDFHLNKMWLQR